MGCSAIRTKSELHPTKNRLWGGLSCTWMAASNETLFGGGGTTFTKSRNSWPGTRWPAIYKQQSSLFACSTSLPAQFHAVSTWYSHSHDQPKQWHDAALKVNSSAKDHERNAKLSLQQQNNRLLWNHLRFRPTGLLNRGTYLTATIVSLESHLQFQPWDGLSCFFVSRQFLGEAESSTIVNHCE